jgi:predicted transcriptional regulator
MVEKEKKPIQILRDKHGGMSESLKEYVKDQNQVRKAITGSLKMGAKTIPQIATETGIKSEKVIWHVMAMKKYGDVVETGRSGDYYSYKLKGGA